MNYALLFVIILLGMGGYYEYSNLTKEIKQDQQTQSDQTDKLTALQAETDTLTKNNADLTNQLNSTKQQLLAAQAAVRATQPPTSPAPGSAPVGPPGKGNAAAAANTPPAGGISADKVAQGIVIIKGDNAEGTGFLVKTANGPAVITNQHVLGNNPNLHIQTTTGVVLTPTGVKAATDRDLAMLTIADGPYTYLPLATDLSTIAHANDDVITPGNSEGGDVALTTTGQLVAIGPDRVEINNPIFHGNSGGPVFHVKSGTVIGVVTEAMTVDLSDDLDKASFTSRNSAIKSNKRYFALRIDTVPKWEDVDLRQFENETTFLDKFEEQSERLDSFLNSKQDKSQSVDAKIYEQDERIMTAWQSFQTRLAGADMGGKLDALRQLSFDLGGVADRDLSTVQTQGNFYSYNQHLAHDEADYRVALKKELDDFSSDVNRISFLPRTNN
jgi:S1-C subfamily serine protease